MNDHETGKPVRRMRTWYKRRLRNRRIALLVVVVVLVVGIVAWVGSSLFPVSEADSKPAASPHNVRGFTPEEIGKLAEHGDAEAQWRLGNLYRDGDGIRKNDAEAVEWFRRSAEQRFVPAASALGSQYWAGHGVAQDYNKAYFWYDVALAEGDEKAESQLQDLSPELTPEEVATIHQQVKAWLQAHGCANEPAPK
jgi:Sel1 repeat